METVWPKFLATMERHDRSTHRATRPAPFLDGSEQLPHVVTSSCSAISAASVLRFSMPIFPSHKDYLLEGLGCLSNRVCSCNRTAQHGPQNPYQMPCASGSTVFRQLFDFVVVPLAGLEPARV
jgi:hypothetical protein